MGSKRSLLRNGLGEHLLRLAEQSERFVDLFGGTGAVGAHVAENVRVPVVSVDLQNYAAALSGAVLLRTRPTRAACLVDEWLGEAVGGFRRSRRRARPYVDWEHAGPDDVTAARMRCAEPSRIGPVWNAYGGHYYSPDQALAFDYLLRGLPDDTASRQLCLAAVLRAASRCAASPGHTAQPFQPSTNAMPSIRSAWKRDPFTIVENELVDLAPRHALRRGTAIVGDANDFAANLRHTDLVFLDPPYSAAQYSRFYHVLETMAVGTCGPVTGAGRYPPIAERPSSEYSRKSAASAALTHLLADLADTGCRTVMTFPQHASSNGLSGEQIIELARTMFTVDVEQVATRFSTMGGNGAMRAPRHRSSELILTMYPR